MPMVRSTAVFVAAAFASVAAFGQGSTAQAQNAIDAAHELAQMLDNAAVDLSGDSLLSALQGAAETGEPIALWQLGLMYESGVGVEKDQAKAFGYFSRIADEHADAPPRSLDADIVAQSFVKMGYYYSEGIPDAGIAADRARAYGLLYHAAVYFGDADAQYRLFLSEQESGYLPAQSARWLALAARKGHPGAQARLGQLMFSGEGVDAQPIEGLMWLNLAHRRSLGTSDEGWIREMADAAMSQADAGQIEAAIRAADTLGTQFTGY